MVYKVLYIEDQDPASIKAELEKGNKLNVVPLSPDNIESAISNSVDKDLLIMDFNLKESKSIVDAPAITQAFRTSSSKSYRDIPIILLSSENNITDYYKDFTSQDLFDLSISKEHYLNNVDKYNYRFITLIKSYNAIKTGKKNIHNILGINEDQLSKLDYRIKFHLNKDSVINDTYAYSNFILQNVIRSIGVLIGEDVLSARLGISKDSLDWEALKKELFSHKYKGIFSDSYDRWWSDDISIWFKEQSSLNSSLRRLTADKRCEEIKKITKLENLDSLTPIESGKYKAKSARFWTICKEEKIPIDYIDGFEIYERELYPWQDPEYLSMLGVSSKKYSKFIKPGDKARLIEIEKTLR